MDRRTRIGASTASAQGRPLNSAPFGRSRMPQPSQGPDPVFVIPDRLIAACAPHQSRREWLQDLPSAIHELSDRWALTPDTPFMGPEVSCAWVAPVARADGTTAVLKIGMPHMEGVDEIEGLRFWNGNPTVRLLRSDLQLNAMLLEQCQPGSSLRELPEPEQDIVLASLLRRLWRPPPEPPAFRPLAAMIDHWAAETLASVRSWPDPGLVEAGLRLMTSLSQPAPSDVMLATDLHAGNVLRAEREPWLVIDPKPFVGDAAYDATQHLLNCAGRLLANPHEVIVRFADLLELDAARVSLWVFARAAADPRPTWTDESLVLARLLGRTISV